MTDTEFQAFLAEFQADIQPIMAALTVFAAKWGLRQDEMDNLPAAQNEQLAAVLQRFERLLALQLQ